MSVSRKKKVVEVVAKALSLLQPESKTSQSETAVTVTSKKSDVMGSDQGSIC